MRKLVTKRTINNITPIEGADMIVLAQIDGWRVVVKKDEFKVGDECVYFEIDSFLPADDERYAFLLKGTKTKNVEGRERIRLRSIRLRGELSQGLALPVSLFKEVLDNPDLEDYSEVLQVTKYEREEPKHPNAVGSLPHWLSKTDEERIQNIYSRFSTRFSDAEFIPTMKLDGTSTTLVFLGVDQKDKWLYEGDIPDDSTDNDMLRVMIVSEWDKKVGEFHLFSRSLQINFDPESHYYRALINEDDNVASSLLSLCLATKKSFAVRGETMGEGICGNPEKLTRFKFFAYNLMDVSTGSYVPYPEAIALFNKFNIPMVPVLGEPIKVFQTFDSVDAILEHAEGESLFSKIREGVVWKHVSDGDVSFKAISNSFLLKVEGKQ